MRIDNRYSINREWCGYDTPRYVARFCDEWIGQSETQEGAGKLCKAHRAEWLAAFGLEPCA